MADSRKTFTIEHRDSGNLVVTEEVLCSIAALAATEVKGVYGIEGSIGSEISKYIGRNNPAKGIKVEMGEDELTFEIPIKISYGYNILEVSSAIQEKVRSTVENMTGIKVSDVNVNIADVAMDDDK